MRTVDAKQPDNVLVCEAYERVNGVVKQVLSPPLERFWVDIELDPPE